jgi:hypothetical protein
MKSLPCARAVPMVITRPEERMLHAMVFCTTGQKKKNETEIPEFELEISET